MTRKRRTVAEQLAAARRRKSRTFVFLTPRTPHRVQRTLPGTSITVDDLRREFYRELVSTRVRCRDELPATIRMRRIVETIPNEFRKGSLNELERRTAQSVADRLLR